MRESSKAIVLMIRSISAASCSSTSHASAREWDGMRSKTSSRACIKRVHAAGWAAISARCRTAILPRILYKTLVDHLPEGSRSLMRST